MVSPLELEAAGIEPAASWLEGRLPGVGAFLRKDGLNSGDAARPMLRTWVPQGQELGLISPTMWPNGMAGR